MSEHHFQAAHDLMTTAAMNFGEMAIDMTEKFDDEIAPQLEAIDAKVADRANHTPVSNFRIPSGLKKRAKQRATDEGRSLTDVVVEHLTQYVNEGK